MVGFKVSSPGVMSRPPSYSFTGGVLPTLTHPADALRVERCERLRIRCIPDQTLAMRRKYSLMPMPKLGHFEDIKTKLRCYDLKRSNSLPDRKALERLVCKFNIDFIHDGRKLSKTRSVTFQPEIVAINAAADNDLPELQGLLDKEMIDVNYKNGSGMSLVHHAAMTGSFECIEVLIEYGAELNSYDDDGNSPLDLAIRGGFFDCASLLITSGAKVERIVNGIEDSRK